MIMANGARPSLSTPRATGRDPVPPLFSVRPVDYARVAEGGAPGAPRRVMLFAALDARAGPRVWRHGGRGPDAFDWLGVVRHCASVAAESCLERGPLPDLAGFASSWDDGPPPEAAGALCAVWGLERRDPASVRPGDVLLFAMPAAHAGVVTACDAQRGP